MSYNYLSEDYLAHFIKHALREDIGDGDHSALGAIDSSANKKAKLLIKSEGMLAGVELSKKIFEFVSEDIIIDQQMNDGDQIKYGDIAFFVEGSAQKILSAERLVLNCMQRMSGIATYTLYLNSLLKGTTTQLLDTRKTTPNFRLAEKWAVKIGGGANHRFGLFDMVMLKDNHIDYAGGVRQAIESTVAYLEKSGKNLKIEIEVRNLDEVQEVLNTGKVFRLLLDNMLPSEMRQAIKMIKGQYETEASGGITEKNIREIAETGVDYISVGALTHSYTSLDMSLKAV
ncbi:MAG: nicotinate-nucleotide pyrophosphorylase (carboxylating) [Cyclobacteriaceae bacterium]|jgi:nicotinate-nucleotide pyrophosphorylase (carboxylating)